MNLLEHQPRVRRLAKTYAWATGAALDLEDLTQAGMLGIAYAAKEKWDASRDVPEWGYLLWWARKYIQLEVERLGECMAKPRRVPFGRIRTKDIDAARDGAGRGLALREILPGPPDTSAEPAYRSALTRLTKAERDTVLRTLKGEPLEKIAASERIGKKAARKRCTTALAKLRRWAR